MKGAVNLTKAGCSWSLELTPSSDRGRGLPPAHRLAAKLAKYLSWAVSEETDLS